MTTLLMSEWIQNDVWDFFTKNPLVAHTIFEKKDSESLIKIVVDSMNKCPDNFYNTDYRHTWRTQEYVNLLKQWIKNN